jgi:uncharacterized Zn finger protein (UPF0148 family)/predicted RNA-binding Zn-ribbon protein involved in translation (DUF1610 family)
MGHGPWSGRQMEASKCPKCGEEPLFLEHVEKWYCYGCNSYIEESEDEHLCTPESAATEPVAAIAQELRELDEEPEVECKNCGASLQNLKDGRLFCFVCETYQDEMNPEPEKEKPCNEAQTLLETALPQAVVERDSEISQPAVDVKPEAVPVGQEPPLEVESEQPIGAKPEKLPEIRMCSICGQPLKYIEKYQRHYCYGCRKYAAKIELPNASIGVEQDASDLKDCPDCGSALKYIEKYHEHYCFTCKKYPLRTKRTTAEKAVAPAKPGIPVCPGCGEPLKYIEKYQRHYCYDCKEYAPKGYTGHSSQPNEKKACPTCHENMKYIAEYSEWYCLKCRKYSLRPSKPVLLF